MKWPFISRKRHEAEVARYREWLREASERSSETHSRTMRAWDETIEKYHHALSELSFYRAEANTLRGILIGMGHKSANEFGPYFTQDGKVVPINRLRA